MARLQVFNIFSNLDSVKDLARYVSAWVRQATTEINGRLEFRENVRASGPHVVSFTSSAEVKTVEHNLRIVPNGFLVIKANSAQVIYSAGATYAWTDTQIFLQAGGAVEASIYVI